MESGIVVIGKNSLSRWELSEIRCASREGKVVAVLWAFFINGKVFPLTIFTGAAKRYLITANLGFQSCGQFVAVVQFHHGRHLVVEIRVFISLYLESSPQYIIRERTE